jgi:hypothetical protein
VRTLTYPNRDLRALPLVASEVLESLYQHRLLTTRQIHLMHTPHASRRWTRHVLTGLTRRGLTSYVRARKGGGGLYFLTPAGADAVELITTRAEMRRKLISAEQAAGPLRAHTLAVNEAGIAFLIAARARRDECGPLGWQHEIVHPVGRKRGELLIADALLSYLQHRLDGELAFHYRLLELDRATVPSDTLATKLARYTRLYRYTPESQREPLWRRRYPVFPGIICVLAGQPRSVLERRARTVLALCHEDAELRRTPQVEISLCLLDDLDAHGPFAAIWQRPDQPDQHLDWLGSPAADNRDRGPAR